VLFLANVLQPLIDFFESFLIFFHDTIGMGWGLAIIALTVVIRAALLPLTLKQVKSMHRLAQFTPEMKRLQEKYKNDRERLNQEMMRFYKENKINPAASCLPLIAQLPVFLALFYMLQNDLRYDICPEVNPPGTPDPKPCGEGGDASFLFIPDLTNRAYGAVLVTLIVLYVGSQVLSFMLSSNPTQDKRQRMLFMALPFFFVLFVWQFPAGLLVYWITTNLWTIVQQAIVRKRLGPFTPPSPTDALAVAGVGGGGKGGGSSGKADGKAPRAPGRSVSREKVASGTGTARRQASPPPPPRKKKKRSGRRR